MRSWAMSWALMVIFGALPSKAATPVGVLGLSGLGIDDSETRSLERLLERTVSDLTGGNLVSPEQIEATLIDPSLRHLRNCAGDVNCLLDLCAVLEVGQLIYGNVTRAGKGYMLSLRLIDSEVAGESARIKKELAEDRDLVVAALREAVTSIIDPSKFMASLSVVPSVPEAKVKLDGEVVETSKGPLNVTIGQHTVTVTAPGYRTLTAMVDVRFGEEAHVEANLGRASFDISQAFTMSWPSLAVWSGVGALATGGVFAVLTAREQNNYEEAYNDPRNRRAVFFQKSQDRGERYAQWTNITLIAGSVLVSAGVTGWLLGGGDE